MPFLSLLLLLILGSYIPGNIVGAAENNSCLSCHKDLPSGSYTGHKFSDYTGSVHDRNDVRCEACHGGDPKRTDKTAAHAGILRSNDPRSSIYFTNLPQTCGKCHGDELINFTRSKHYAELKMAGRGPSCVTCHGSMGTFILNSGQIQEFCTICHNLQKGILPNVPMEVENVLSMLELADTLVSWSEEYVKEAQKLKRETSQSEKQLTIARNNIKHAKLAWHTFRMQDVTTKIKDAYSAAKKARESIR